MSKDLDVLLDKCIDRMNEGESLEGCLASYPENAEELEPLLRAMYNFRDTCSTMPRATAKSVVRRRLDAALVNSDRRLQERERRPTPFFGWSRVWATVSIVLVLALIGFGLYWILPPGVVPVLAQANFRLLLSDQENAIGDFASLNVTITSIGMLRAGDGGEWEVIELEPSAVVDLTRLQGLNAQEIWSGIILEGQYTQVFIYIENATGTINGETVNVIVPSGNLQISKPFAIIAGDSIVSFVHDITVVAAGNEQSGIKYILLPQVDQSGPNQPHHEVGEGALILEVVDPEPPIPVTPGDNITVVVTFQGDAMPGAQVKVNGKHYGNTGGDGRISFPVPIAEELKIKAKIYTAQGELEGKLRIDFGDELTLKVVDATTLEVLDSDVIPGHEIKVQVTFETLQGSTILMQGAQVKVKHVGVFTTGNDGLTTDSFMVPYDDELEIKAVKGKLKGELEIEFEDELTLQVIDATTLQAIDDDDVTPGDIVFVRVTLAGSNVENAQVKVKHVGDFTTGNNGLTTDSFMVPYDDELEIKAVKDGLKGKLEIELEGEPEIKLQEEPKGELTLKVVDADTLQAIDDDDVTPGDIVFVLVTLEGEPVEGAIVTVEDVGDFTTGNNGLTTDSFTVPDDDELEIKAVKDGLKGKLEIELEED